MKFLAAKYGHVFPEKFKFYVGWTDKASQIMLAMDDELNDLLGHIKEFDTSSIKRLTEHYEAPTVEAMTAKINSIEAFQSHYAPLKPSQDQTGFVADIGSRMFTEDFPWGLLIFRSYCDFFGTDAPEMDKLLMWYADYMGLDWYRDGKLCGEDLRYTGIPQRYGISSKEELMDYYR